MRSFDIRLERFDDDADEPPAAALGRLFGMPPAAAQKLVASLPRVVKREVREDKATRIVEALKAVGAEVVLEPSPIRPATMMPVGQAVKRANNDLPDMAAHPATTPGGPGATADTVTLESRGASGGTLVLNSAPPPPGAPAHGPIAANRQHDGHQPQDPGSTAALQRGNDPWAPKTTDPRSAQTAVIPVASGPVDSRPVPSAPVTSGPVAPAPVDSDRPPRGAQALPHPAIPAPVLPPAAAPVSLSGAPTAPEMTPHPAPDSAAPAAVSIPAPVLPGGASEATPVSIPAPAIARTSERVSLAAPIADASGDGAPLPLAMVAAALNRDSAGSFPGIELSGDVAQRSADSMELSRNPLEFVSQPPPSVPPAGSSGGLLDPSIDGHHDALALPPSDAPPPPEPPQRSRPNPSMGPAAAGTVGTPVPTLYDDRRPSQRQPPGRTTPVQHATPKAFGLLGGVALFTLALYAIFVW